MGIIHDRAEFRTVCFCMFFYMVIECMDECRRMVLIFDKRAQKKNIKDKVLLEVFEEGKKDGEYPFARKIFFSESKDIFHL